MTQATTTLSPDEWKNLAVFNAAQLQNYIQSIPAMGEGGLAGMTDEHLAIIGKHVERGHSFLKAWRVSRLPQVQSSPTLTIQAGNGAAHPKRRGGWPKGKPRTRQAAVTQ